MNDFYDVYINGNEQMLSINQKYKKLLNYHIIDHFLSANPSGLAGYEETWNTAMFAETFPMNQSIQRHYAEHYQDN